MSDGDGGLGVIEAAFFVCFEVAFLCFLFTCKAFRAPPAPPPPTPPSGDGTGGPGEGAADDAAKGDDGTEPPPPPAKDEGPPPPPVDDTGDVEKVVKCVDLNEPCPMNPTDVARAKGFGGNAVAEWVDSACGQGIYRVRPVITQPFIDKVFLVCNPQTRTWWICGTLADAKEIACRT